MRRYVSMLLLVILSLSFSACSSPAEPVKIEPEQTEEEFHEDVIYLITEVMEDLNSIPSDAVTPLGRIEMDSSLRKELVERVNRVEFNIDKLSSIVPFEGYEELYSEFIGDIGNAHEDIGMGFIEAFDRNDLITVSERLGAMVAFNNRVSRYAEESMEIYNK